MPFGVVSGVSQGIDVLDGVMIVDGEGAVLRVNVGCPIVTSGILCMRGSDVLFLWLWRGLVSIAVEFHCSVCQFVCC